MDITKSSMNTNKIFYLVTKEVFLMFDLPGKSVSMLTYFHVGMYDFLISPADIPLWFDLRPFSQGHEFCELHCELYGILLGKVYTWVLLMQCVLKGSEKLL